MDVKYCSIVSSCGDDFRKIEFFQRIEIRKIVPIANAFHKLLGRLIGDQNTLSYLTSTKFFL